MSSGGGWGTFVGAARLIRRACGGASQGFRIFTKFVPRRNLNLLMLHLRRSKML